MEIEVTQSVDERETTQEQEKPKGNLSDYSQRAQCLRAMVLGGNEGLVGIMLLLIVVESFTHDNYSKAVLTTGFATLIAGALSIGTAEFVSCYTQVDIMDFQAKKYMSTGEVRMVLHGILLPSIFKFLRKKGFDGAPVGALRAFTGEPGKIDIVKNIGAPNPTQIALAASLAYAVAGTIPLLAASFISDHKMRLSIAATTTCLSMIGLGAIGASLGKAPIARSCARVLCGGCVEVMVLVAKSYVLEAYRVLKDKK